MSPAVSAKAPLPVQAGAPPYAEVRSLAGSFHVATPDHDAPAIFDGTLTFIREHGYKD